MFAIGFILWLVTTFFIANYHLGRAETTVCILQAIGVLLVLVSVFIWLWEVMP